MEERWQERLAPYRRALTAAMRRLHHRIQAGDDALNTWMHPHRQRVGRAYRHGLKRYPYWDVTWGRFRVVGTLLWAHVGTFRNFVVRHVSRRLRPSWPPKKGADWVGASLLLGILWVGAHLTVHIPTVPSPAREWEVIGYYENDPGGIYGSSLPTLQAKSALIDTVSPFWYVVGDAGEIVLARHDPEAMHTARTAGLRVIPLVSNALPKEGPYHQFIATPEQRARTSENLLALVDERGYDGFNVYFPWLGPEGQASLTAFLELLSSELGARGRILGVSVYPREESPESLHGAFDYEALAGWADYIVLMAYDLHWEQTEPGPTAPLHWVEKNVTSALVDIPSEQLVLGTGLFGYDWATADIPTQYLPAHGAQARAARLGITIQRDPEAGQPHYTYRTAGIQHQVWFEDSTSFNQKMELVSRYDLRGLALWRLGFEPPEVWELIAHRLGER